MSPYFKPSKRQGRSKDGPMHENKMECKVQGLFSLIYLIDTNFSKKIFDVSIEI